MLPSQLCHAHLSSSEHADLPSAHAAIVHCLGPAPGRLCWGRWCKSPGVLLLGRASEDRVAIGSVWCGRGTARTGVNMHTIAASEARKPLPMQATDELSNAMHQTAADCIGVECDGWAVTSCYGPQTTKEGLPPGRVRSLHVPRRITT